MASTYYVKKDGKFPRALFAEHTGRANFIFHMPNGVMAAKESHSCLRSIQSGNWKLITKEEAFALKEKKVIQSFPKYYIHKECRPFLGGAVFAKRISENTYAFIDPDGTNKDDLRNWSLSQTEWVQNGLWVEISEEAALAMIQYPKYYVHQDRITFGGGGVLVRRMSPNDLQFVRSDGTTYDKRHWGFCEAEWAKSGLWREISKEEADKLLKQKEPAVPTLKFSGPGVYLTAGGYLVELDAGLAALKRHSPGVNIYGSSSQYGWSWHTNGTITELQPEWYEKLRLVEKMPDGFVIPPETDEFVYADGYPMIRAPKKGEYYIQLQALKEGQKYQPLLASCPDGMYSLPIHQSVLFVRNTKEVHAKYYIRHNNLMFGNNIAFIEHSADGKRINHYFDGTTKLGVNPTWSSAVQDFVNDGSWIEISLEQGKQLIANKNEPVPCPITVDGQYELMNGQIVNLKLTSHKDLAWSVYTDQVKASDGTIAAWVWNADGTIGGLGNKEYCKSLYVKRHIGPPKEESVTNVSTEPQTTVIGEKEMKSETTVAVAKGAGNLALRALNYWAWEPAKHMGGRVLSSIRYVTFFVGITACILGYNYPTQTKALVKSALPKVHFSVERPELLK